MDAAQKVEFKAKLLHIYTEALKGTDPKSYLDLAKDLRRLIDNMVAGKRALLGLTFQVGESTQYDNARIPLAKFARELLAASISTSDALEVAMEFFSDPTLISNPLLEALKQSFGNSMHVGTTHTTDAVGAAAGAVVSRSEGSHSGARPDAPITIQWLNKMLTKLVTSAETESFSINQNGSEVTVTIKGPLPLHYAARSFLMSMAPDAKPLPVLVNPETTDSVFAIDAKKIEKAKADQQAVDFTRMWLDGQGFKVATGSKHCADELWVNVRPVEARDDRSCREECGVSLAVADKIATFTETRCIFPTTVQVEAGGRARDQLEFYYKEAKLTGADKQPKQFILDELGQKTNRSNISLGQAQSIWPYFQRLDMLATRFKVRCATLNDEAAVKTAQEGIRGNSLKAQEELLKGFKYKRSETSSSSSYLALEAAARPSSSVSSVASSLAGMFASRGASSSDTRGLSEIEYERAFESMVNQLLILGPEAYRLILKADCELATGVRSVERVLNSQSGGGARPLALTDGGDFRGAVAREVALVRRTPPATALVGYNPEFARRFAQAPGRPSIAEYYFVMGQEIAPDLFTSPVGDKEPRLSELKRLGSSDLRGRLEPELRDFYDKHSPYYFIKQLAGTLNSLLENPATSEEAIAEILLKFGVKEADLDQYKVRGMPLFNRYQIKFDALALALTACLTNGVVLNLRHMAENNHPWVFNPQSRNTATSASSMRTAIEWQLDRVFNVGWSAGTARELSFNSYTTSGQGTGGALHTAGAFGGSQLSSGSSYSGSQMQQSGSGASSSSYKSS